MLKRTHAGLRAGAVALLLATSATARPAPQIATTNTSSPRTPSPHDFAGVIRLELAGRALETYPYFEFVRTFITDTTIQIAVDPTRYPAIIGWNGPVYVVEHKAPEVWEADATLHDVRGEPQPMAFDGTDVRGNRLRLAQTDLPVSSVDASLARPLDVVLDTNQNGQLDAGDWIDGLDDQAGEPGFFIARRTQDAGPYEVTETVYSGGTFLTQDLYHPSLIETMGQLPLVVVSHGNGHQYTWYDHIGYHLASYGFIVMSHRNNTQPGIESASTTTLTNTDYLLENQATVAGGALAGHVDVHKIIWIGHSRGGEGVVRAYDRVFDGTYVPSHFTLSDIVLVSSIAPTDFLGPASSNPHGANYHLWVGGADDDVSGCADCVQCQSFHLLDRATGCRQSISLHGVGHGAFHNGGGSNVSFGPCQLSRAETHSIMASYLLPLARRYTDGDLAAEDFLWRQWEGFHSLGVPENACVVVDLQYSPAPSADRFVIDDFQTEPATTVSSCGGAVSSDLTDLLEGRFDDPNANFTANGTPMNGMTAGDSADTTAGITFGWDGVDRELRFDLPPGREDVRGYRYVSFRACQSTRDPLTVAELGDLRFEVGLRDGQGTASFIGVGAYGGGIEEPYQRVGCGTGVGWANEFETIRIRLEDFTRDGTGLDLSDVRSIELRCGPSHGSNEGRVGFDDLVLTRE